MPAPIRPGSPQAPPTVSSTTATANPAPATPAAPSAPARPAVWGTPTGPAPRDAFNAVTNTVATAVRGAGKGHYELVPGRYPDAVGLPQVLAQVGSTPQGQAAVGKLLENLKAKTGVDVPPELKAAILANPSAATKAFEVTPGQLSAGIAGMNAAYQAGKVKAPEPRKLLLPQKFDLSKLDSLDLPRPKSELKELGPGLYTGDLPSAASDAQVKQNRVMAEVMHRLSGNASLPEGQRFEVAYNGSKYTRLDNFLSALKKDGCEVNVNFEQRVANFAGLHTAVPGTNPPKFVDVPAPMMVRTGFKDAAGNEAVVPAAHSEMIVSVKSGPNSRGPKLDAQMKYYQGTTGTGFFATNVHAEPSWLGRVKHAELTGDKALEAVKLAGAFTDVVNTTAKAQNLYADGYGVTGVCNDSVAVVQQAVMGKADQYPLLMKDDVLFGELKARLGDANRRDDPLYRTLHEAIVKLPSDTQPNASMKARALSSLPWAAGREPFESSVEARRILSQ